ncbi:hypothetical protein BN3659_01345 [Alistipes sp. CHKCI003]|nr:hypothetical protein BN3659_01345 [Alistipes sp. CHKCI003]
MYSFRTFSFAHTKIEIYFGNKNRFHTYFFNRFQTYSGRSGQACNEP